MPIRAISAKDFTSSSLLVWLVLTAFFLLGQHLRHCEAAFKNVNGAEAWRGAVPLLYQVDSRLSSRAKDAITAALASVTNAVPGLTFQAVTTATNYLAFILENNRTVCEDETLQIGRNTAGVTNVFITETSYAQCGTKGWVLHLLMHALGFYHEHQRSDRDTMVYVNYGNVMLSSAARAALFDVVQSNGVATVGGYDLSSATHYDYHAMAYPGKTTIVAVPVEFYSLLSYGHATNFRYTDESVLSYSDILALRAIFPSTNPAPSLPVGTCEHGGVWHNWCLCPVGYGGKTCSDVYCNNECQNGGTCKISLVTGLPTCSCPEGSSGNYCEIIETSGTCTGCPWWSACNTQTSNCICDPYPYAGDNCSAVISDAIPTTPPAATPAPLPATILPPDVVVAINPAVTTQAPINCDISSALVAKRMIFSNKFIYLRVVLADIAYVADYADLGSSASVSLQAFLTDTLQGSYGAQSGSTFLGILLANIQSTSTKCTVVDYLAKFSVPVTPTLSTNIVQATQQRPALVGQASNRSSRIAGFFYIGTSAQVRDAKSLCAVFDAEKLCKNGASCTPVGNQPTCVCTTPDYSGSFCENQSNGAVGGGDAWPALHIVIVALGATIIVMLLVLLFSLLVQYAKIKNWPPQRRRRTNNHFVHGSSDLAVVPARAPTYIIPVADPVTSHNNHKMSVPTVTVAPPSAPLQSVLKKSPPRQSNLKPRIAAKFNRALQASSVQL